MNIWGIHNIEEVFLGSEVWWKFPMDHAFYYKGRQSVGINERFIQKAKLRGVTKFMIMIDGKEHLMDCPNDIKLKGMNKEGRFGERESKFEGASKMKIYYFSL